MIATELLAEIRKGRFFRKLHIARSLRSTGWTKHERATFFFGYRRAEYDAYDDFKIVIKEVRQDAS